MLLVVVALHLFLYPASNGYNSYFDKDEKSIGGLKHPPKVTRDLYYTALIFDLAAIALGFLINTTFGVMLLVYGLVSKAYSHPSIRIKKYPWLSWFIAGLFQGWFTFLMAFSGLNDFPADVLLKSHIQIPALLSSLILWGSYPMTQIYQHEEDLKRGDKTLSSQLGVLGTFHFTAICFALASLAYVIYFNHAYSLKYGLGFLMAMAPVILYFFTWYFRVRKNQSKADFEHTMRLNFLSALMLNVFFIYFFLDSTQVLQAINAGY